LWKSGQVECLGRGPGAPWRRKGITLKKGKKEGNNIFSSTGLSIYHGYESRTRDTMFNCSMLLC
jgi:hypothetical protein